ncbi:MAG: TSUP family transporter [SAR324 cluster bacterium]|nr:TSUP family transporter [SAR324 cluster bacterium]
MSRQEIFCETYWKVKALFLSAICLGLFAWGFYILYDYRQHNVVTPMQAKAIPAGIGSVNLGKEPSFPLDFKKTVVTVAGLVDQTGEFADVGSGVVISDDGYMVTALHLISNFQEIKVNNGTQQYDALIIKRLTDHNLALLKIVSNEHFPYVGLDGYLGQSEIVYAFGRQNGLLAKPGFITNTETDLAIGDVIFAKWIETNAIYTWSQSGGPLMNLDGRMLGVNVAIKDSSNRIRGYAIPSQLIFQHTREIVGYETLANINLYTRELQRGWTKTAQAIAESILQDVADSPAWTYLPTFAQDQQAEIMQGSQQIVEKLVQLYNHTDSVHAAVRVASDPAFTFFGHTLVSMLSLFALGLVSGVSAGMVTMGGGIIKVTGLIVFFGYGLTIIRPVAYLTNIFVYGAAALRYRKDKMVSWDNIKPLIPFAIFGFFLGYFTGNYMNNQTIRYMLGAFALFIAVKMVFEIYGSALGIGTDEREKKSKLKEGHRWKYGWLGMPMGIVSGILGISGGVIEVPMQRYFAKVPLKEAIANSSVLVFYTSLLGGVIATIHGIGIGAFDIQTPIILTAIIMPGAYLGGMIGAWLTKTMPINALKSVYTILMFVIAIRMLFSFV